MKTENKYSYDVASPEFIASEFAETFEDLTDNIRNSIPLDYSETHYGENIHRVISLELERISAAMYVVMRNTFIHLTDENGMAVWENMAGIPIEHADTLEQRRKYMQAKLTGRHIFLGYHFDAGLESLGGPIRKYVYDPETAQASVMFVEPLSEAELLKIRFYCQNVGPAHIRWMIDSPGAGDGWRPSTASEYSAPWLRSDPDQESVYLHKRWTELTADQRQEYVDAARADFASMTDEEKDEIYGQRTEPDWMTVDWKNTPNDGSFTDDDAPPRYDEYI